MELQTLLVTGRGPLWSYYGWKFDVFGLSPRNGDDWTCSNHLNAQFPESFMIRFFNRTSHTGELTQDSRPDCGEVRDMAKCLLQDWKQLHRKRTDWLGKKYVKLSERLHNLTRRSTLEVTVKFFCQKAVFERFHQVIWIHYGLRSIDSQQKDDFENNWSILFCLATPFPTTCLPKQERQRNEREP